jgi:tetrahydromethanopterin S-methyltransferase subunit H
MADLSTLAGIEAELADTADYDVAADVPKAMRRVAALRRKLDFPQSTGRGEQNVAFAMQAIENQLQQALVFIATNETPSEAQRLANPDVVHADFSTFRGYSCG